MNNDLINELNNKIDAQDKIIKYQALEIAKLNKQLENENKVVQEYLELEKEYEELKEINNSIKEVDRKLLERIGKAIKYIKEHEEKQFAFNFEYALRDNEIEELLEILGKKE